MDNNRIKKSQYVFNAIIEGIKIKKIKSGDLLPTEAELSKKYNVGRGSVREANQSLEMMGIVKRQAGIGTIVNDFSMDTIFNPGNLQFDLDYKNLSQLLDFRKFFEEIIIMMLLEKISEEDLKDLKEIVDLERFYYERNNLEKFSEYDFLFHSKLAYSTNNIAVTSIHNIIFPFLKYIMRETVTVAKRLDETLTDHEEILEGIQSKDSKKVKEAISRHILHVKDFLKQSLK